MGEGKYHDTVITLQVPPKTTYEYKLEGNALTHLVYHNGMTVTIGNYYDNSGLVLVALSNKNLLNDGKEIERFEHKADPESTIVRYWRNSNVTGGIQCTGDINILVRNVSSTSKGDIPTPDCSNTDNAINCGTYEKIEVSTITSNATCTGDGDLTVIQICAENDTDSSASVDFLEPLHDLADMPIYQLDSRHTKVRIGYSKFASTIANRRPALYVSTHYIQYDKGDESKVSVMPITMTIEFEDTLAYIVSFIVICVLVFLTLLLLLLCYYRHSDKQSCAAACLYYPQ